MPRFSVDIPDVVLYAVVEAPDAGTAREAARRAIFGMDSIPADALKQKLGDVGVEITAIAIPDWPQVTVIGEL